MFPITDLNPSNKAFALNLNGSQIEKLFQTLPDLVYVFDLKIHKLVFINNQVTNLLGYTADDIEKMGTIFPSLILHDTPRDFLQEMLPRYTELKEEESDEFLINIRHKDGTARTFRNRISVLQQEESGKNWLILNVAEDITDGILNEKMFKQRQQQLAEAESIFKYGSWEWQVNQDYITWTDGIFEILGLDKSDYPDGRVPADLYDKFIPEPDRTQALAASMAYINANAPYYEIEYALIDSRGQRKQMITRARRFDEKEGVPRVLGSVTDITSLKRYEEELERQIAALNKSNRDLEQFAYVASHDLQEPLRKIIAFGERLDKKYKEQLGTEGKFFVERMTNAASRMHGLIEDLLAYSRASRQGESNTALSLNDVVKRVIEDLEIKIKEANASIEASDLPTLKAQPTQMHQLFLNLIENAIKFRKPNHPPLIKIEEQTATLHEIQQNKVLNPNFSYCRIIVSDNGIGFAPEYAERIFTIFQRLHGRSEFEGTGLGLAICRKIVENHGGSIEAHGQEGEGSQFVIYLPIHP